MGADVKQYSDVKEYLERLRKEVVVLGAGGGLAAASIYDTAQVLRYAPDPDPQRRLKVVEWLLEQQQVQGEGKAKGWGKRGVSPLAQSVPTMAAMLALHEHSADYPEDLRKRVQEAVEQGRLFMRQNAQAWAAAVPLPDDIPVAVELILPRLLDDAPTDWDLPRPPFQDLRALGQKRLALIARFKPGPDSTPAHAWESWGGEPEERWLMSVGTRVTDGATSGTTSGTTERVTVGHSPSATAFWLKNKREEFKKLHGDDSAFEASDFVKKIRNYLADCTASTQTDVSGTYPTCYPINRWEQLWGLLSLFETSVQLLCDVSDGHPHQDAARLKRIFTEQYEEAVAQTRDSLSQLKDDIHEHLRDVQSALKKEGMGLSDHFICDGDDTAAALCALLARKSTAEERKALEASAEALRVRFERGDGQFITYPHELQPSLTTTAHWMPVLKLLKKETSASVRLLVEKREKKEGSRYEGLWLVDKWHCSWLYATSQSMIALEMADDALADEALLKALPRLLELQNADGSWGEHQAAGTETAFGVRSLLCLRGRERFNHLFAADGEVTRAIQKATRWLAAHVAATGAGKPLGETYWIDKEPFATPRLDNLYVLSSLIALKLAGY
jgi:squalene-hopene cyclase-like protein